METIRIRQLEEEVYQLRQENKRLFKENQRHETNYKHRDELQHTLEQRYKKLEKRDEFLYDILENLLHPGDKWCMGYHRLAELFEAAKTTKAKLKQCKKALNKITDGSGWADASDVIEIAEQALEKLNNVKS